jgi:cyclohexa-1,5-dienecarbonyl-CoA hydratase
MAMEFKTIALNVMGPVARLVLKRPPVNVLNIEMMKEMNEALKQVQATGGLRALVLQAEGKFFSAGVDVAEHTKEKVREMIEVFHDIFNNLNKVKIPTVALCAGPALGGGCEVALWCDIVLASERAKFGQPEIKVGVFPPIAAYLLPNTVPMKFAAELLMTGETYSAADMKTMGLVNRVFPDDKFGAEAEVFLEKITSNSSIVLEMTKKAMLAAKGRPYEQAMPDIEHIYLNKLMGTEDASEGLKAFMEKRKPVWKDK